MLVRNPGGIRVRTPTYVRDPISGTLVAARVISNSRGPIATAKDSRQTTASS